MGNGESERNGGGNQRGRAKTPSTSPQQEPPVRIVLRPYASTIPLAAFAFAIGNVLYSAFLLHWVPPADALGLALLLLAFVAPLELFPCVMAFVSRDTGGATAFGIFGAAWVVQGLQLLLFPPGTPSPVGGIFLLTLALCLAILAFVTFHGKPLLGAVLVVAALRTVANALMELGVGYDSAAITGILGLLLAAMAFYAGLAFLEEDVKQVLSPLTFRSGEARAAMEGPLEEQVSAITREAGVRKQL